MGRLIDADKLTDGLEKTILFNQFIGTLCTSPEFKVLIDQFLSSVVKQVKAEPTVDAVPVIRCKDCKWCRTFYHGPDMRFSYECAKLYLTRIEANDFCSKAERKEE